MPKKQIKPYIEEISLAFNPANMKKFILMKEGIMPNLVEILTSKDALLKEKEVDAVLNPLVKEMKLSQEAAEGIKGVLRVLSGGDCSLSLMFWRYPEKCPCGNRLKEHTFSSA